MALWISGITALRPDSSTKPGNMTLVRLPGFACSSETCARCPQHVGKCRHPVAKMARRDRIMGTNLTCALVDAVIPWFIRG